MDINVKHKLKIKLKLEMLVKRKGVLRFDDLNKYFTQEEIKIIKNIYFKEKKYVLDKDIQQILGETPYTILKIEERKYSKEELLEIVSSRINELNNDKNREIKIDKILDSYNSILKKRIK